MQRGPTRGTRRVTLLSREAPSGRSHWVLVRMEDGLSAGSEREVPSQSIYYLSGDEPSPKPHRRIEPKYLSEAPAGWTPKQGELVSWSRTLGSQFTVVEVDTAKGVATIEGVLLGVNEQFNALASELTPRRQPVRGSREGESVARLGDPLPSSIDDEDALAQVSPSRIGSVEKDEGVVDRLVFSPGCLVSYRRRFARDTPPVEAEKMLRAELRQAKMYRRRPQEYLRLRVRGRFEIVLKKRPVQGDLASSYVEGLNFLGQKKRRRPRKEPRRRAA